MFARRDAETRRLSGELYREIVRRADPEQDSWVARDVIERELEVPGDAYYYAAELLVEDGKVDAYTSDLNLLRPARRRRSYSSRTGR
jgi:hypothetical protein